MIRRISLWEGLTPEDDSLPKALFQKMEKTGNAIMPEELDYMRKDYCQLRGWNERDLWPRASSLIDKRNFWELGHNRI